MQFSLVFDRERGKMRVGGQVTGRPDRIEQTEQNFRVAVSRVDEDRLRPVEPGPDTPTGARYVKRIVEDPGIGGDTDETEDRNPWQADSARSVHLRFPPLARRHVSPGSGIVSMNEQVDVGQDHLASRLAISSVSISSKSWLSRSGSLPGLKPKA